MKGVQVMFREITGDLWQLADFGHADAVCITTNGYVRRDGHAVMGRGCALQAAKRWPLLPKVLGDILCHFALATTVLTGDTKRLEISGPQLPYHLVAYPVKPREIVATEFNVVLHHRFHFPPGSILPGWATVALPDLIASSGRQLMGIIKSRGWQRVLLPRPGCGAGGLSWERDVKPLLTPIMDKRVCIVSK
jgi:hypothetical protein